VDWMVTPDVVFSRWITALSLLLFAGLIFFEPRTTRGRLT
jgi:hypothetical protein